MRLVPLIDASGVSALKDFVTRCRKDGTTVILAGVQPQIASVMQKMGLFAANPEIKLVENFDAARAMAQTVIDRR
jgi:SulP family sulfate permease